MKFRIRVPATTANLGPGFDCLGLALNWWNTVEVERITRGLEMDCGSRSAAEFPCDERNLVIRSMRVVFRYARQKFPPLRVRLDCKIPVGRGLGSSAAAIVGGVVAANALLGEKLSRDRLLKLATEIEGHPDNVAPALLGGLVIAVRDGQKLQTARSPVPRGLQCVLFIPEHALSTKLARNVLPRHVPHADAVHNVSRAALWIAALHTRRWDWLGLATGDRLHQPYRAKLVRGMDTLFAAARRAGARGVALSGAGPSLIAFTDRNAIEIARAMHRAAARIALPGDAHIVRASARGAWAKRIG
jgi:homoserine kinase